MLRACDGLLPLPVQEKSLPRSPPSASEVASGFRGFEKLRNLSTSNCFPLDFGELPKPEKPGARDGLGVHLQWVALWACSRWAVPPACRAKGYFEAPWLGFLALRGIENASQTLSARSRLLGRSLGTCTDRYPADAGEEPLMPMLMLGSVLMNYTFLAC